MVERDILKKACITDSHWLVNLLYSFQDPRHLYLAMVSLHYIYFDFFFFF